MGAATTAWALCLAWAVAAAALDDNPAAAALPQERAWPARTVTLRWLHSIERVQWEETYALPAPGAYPALTLERARVVGSGAGMEPAPQAHWRDGGFEWHPRTPVPWLLLARSPFAAEHTLCVDGRCAALSAWLPAQAPATDGVVRLRPCRPTGP